MSSVGGMALNSLPGVRLGTGHKKSGKEEEEERVVVLMNKVLQLPSCSCGYLVAPSLTLLILFIERVSKIGRTSR